MAVRRFVVEVCRVAEVAAEPEAVFFLAVAVDFFFAVVLVVFAVSATTTLNGRMAKVARARAWRK